MKKTFTIATIALIACSTAACGAEFESTFGEGGTGTGAGGSGGTGGDATTSNGGSGGAECIPVDEVCDGVDNDCDGEPDNGLEDCVALTLEFPEETKAMVMLASASSGLAVPGQYTEEPVDGDFTVFLDRSSRLFLRLEAPTFLLAGSNVELNTSTDAFGCVDGPLKVSVDEMEGELENGPFSEGASFDECNASGQCTFSNIGGCSEGEINLFRIDLAPKAASE